MRLTRKLESEGQSLFRRRSYLPLLVVPLTVPALLDAAYLDASISEASQHIWEYFCLLVSAAGIVLRAFTVGFVPAGTSGRTTAAPRADSLNTTGMYSIVRNPLYLGNFIVYLGIALITKSWWFVLLVGLAYWLYIERIIAAEEAYLEAKFGEEFERWAETTPIFLPRLIAWRRPAYPFSLRTVLRREYPGILACAAAFFALNVVEELLVEGETVHDWFSDERVVIIVFAVAILVFLVLRTLKKRTRLLHVSGR